LRWLIRTTLLGLSKRRHRPRGRPDSRYPLLALTVLLIGCLIVTASSSFPPAVAARIGFGTSIPTALVALGALALARAYGKHAFAGISAVVSTLAIWTVVATAWTFSAATARWIAFASGLGYMLGGVVLLVLHETSPERVVHLLEVRQMPARS
jgi:hypothetical protein